MTFNLRASSLWRFQKQIYNIHGENVFRKQITKLWNNNKRREVDEFHARKAFNIEE